MIEVGPRDGFQMEKEFIPTEKKVEIINKLAETGLRKIEVTSFVHPKVIPQLKDAEEVLMRINRDPGITYRAYVPNEFGARRAIEAGIDEMLAVVDASETYSQKNVNMTVEKSILVLKSIIELAKSAKKSVSVGLGHAFGCPYEGDVSEERVLEIIDELLQLGIEELYVADTVGMANPRQVAGLINRIIDRWPDIKPVLHLHDASGMGLANVLAAMDAGVTTFEASICGLGGSPVLPGAKGNIPTEDLVHMLSEMGIQTNIDLDILIECAELVKGVVGREVTSHMLQSGRRSDIIGKMQA